ncbi:uroporphyrinogen-III synthase [Arthrobacter sp. ISL-48]|uniref:uroporphyrinogen-III synthase n=1 Tax=Arthrobacter sp. ISL-48 TaxID=2819110 RepID=UPI001BEB59F2|nr:uroporphyrinogen-III synthase [Arthrobacter sp. ISL-48]MBT2531921.1 uroporphyrinogen-III synthase [Arthrobacter sp. ISL-48]
MAGQDSSGQSHQQPLAHARVLVTRSPERSLSLLAALKRAGAEVLLLPLIDFERAADQHSLDVACDALGAGAFDWLVVSSATTVHVLSDKAAERGVTLGGWIPASTQVAAVGPASRRLLEAEGVSVALTPENSQSAAGLLAVWPQEAGRVLLPQADIAASRLGEGLRATGATVTVVTAYRTVDYPADEERRLSLEPFGAELLQRRPLQTEPPERAADPLSPPSYRLLTPEGARTEIAAHRLHAVVAASPSAVRRIHSSLSPLDRCRLVAIGRSTADAAAALGLDVAAVAADPSPDGLVAAIAEALDSEQPPGPNVKDES